VREEGVGACVCWPLGALEGEARGEEVGLSVRDAKGVAVELGEAVGGSVAPGVLVESTEKVGVEAVEGLLREVAVVLGEGDVEELSEALAGAVALGVAMGDWEAPTVPVAVPVALTLSVAARVPAGVVEGVGDCEDSEDGVGAGLSFALRKGDAVRGAEGVKDALIVAPTVPLPVPLAEPLAEWAGVSVCEVEGERRDEAVAPPAREGVGAAEREASALGVGAALLAVGVEEPLSPPVALALSVSQTTVGVAVPVPSTGVMLAEAAAERVALAEAEREAPLVGNALRREDLLGAEVKDSVTTGVPLALALGASVGEAVAAAV